MPQMGPIHCNEEGITTTRADSFIDILLFYNSKLVIIFATQTHTFRYANRVENSPFGTMGNYDPFDVIPYHTLYPMV